jgi:hypothetical protein
MRTLPLLACLLASCGPVSAPSVPTTTQSATPPEQTQVCTASSVRKAPAHLWPQVGTIVVTMQGGKPASAELRDGTGHVVDTIKIAPGQDGHVILEQATCRLGGVLYQVPGGKPPDGPVELKVLRAAAPNESEDLRKLCSHPDIPEGFDQAQEVRVAVEIFDESLTSPKWRTWMHQLKADIRSAADDAAAAGIRRKYSTDLASAAKAGGVQECWFASRMQ